MIDRWNDQEAEPFLQNPLELRIYTSRLLGREADLVLHGGGNTSVKMDVTDLFGERQAVLFIKGSGRDLAAIASGDFAPVNLAVLQKLAAMEAVADDALVRTQRAAMIDPDAPDPSIEAVLHAIIPFAFVDHTHADAVVTLTNTADGDARIRELYGDRVLVVPYVHPGFALAKAVFAATRQADWRRLKGIIVLKHGVFTFGEDARTSYLRMIEIVTAAETCLDRAGVREFAATEPAPEDLPALSRLRRLVSRLNGSALLARADTGTAARTFAGTDRIADVVARGPLAADHIIRTGRFPLLVTGDEERDTTDFTEKYRRYVTAYAADGPPGPAAAPPPRWAIWPGNGTVCFGETAAQLRTVEAITAHTIRAIGRAEALGGWQGIPEAEIYRMEFWPLQRAKLALQPDRLPLTGKIALVTGAASGIGRACAELLNRQGAAVAALDLNPAVTDLFNAADRLGICGDVTDAPAMKAAVEATVRRFGGLDILIPNAGIFTASSSIESLDDAVWDRSMAINLSSNQRLLKLCIPFLKQGVDAAVVFIASKNVPAPGPGAAAYSVAKAGLTQLARVAALELGCDGIRVNVIHPNAVYDTALWTPEVLESRACHYGCTVEEYKTKNCLRTEVRSADVAALVCAMVGPAFAKTTGAQIPIDGGNERVI